MHTNAVRKATHLGDESSAFLQGHRGTFNCTTRRLLAPVQGRVAEHGVELVVE